MPIQIKIGDHLCDVPQLTVGAFASIGGFDPHNIAHSKLICSTLLGMPLSEFKNVNDVDALQLVAYLLVDLTEAPKLTAVNQDRFAGITIGEFADLDVLIRQDAFGHMPEILAILKDTTADEELRNAFISEWPLYNSYISFRNQVYKNYRNLFELDERSPDEGSTGQPDAARAWYKIFATLANDNFLAIDKVTSRGLTEALNFLSHLKEQNAEIAKELKKKTKIKH